MMDKDITDPSFKYAPSQNPIDPLKTSGSAALPNTMAQQVDFVPSGDDFADTIEKQTRQRIADQTNAMNLAISKAAAGNADEAAAAQRLGYETGVGADIAARNMKALQERVAVDRIGQLDLMRADPVLAKMLSDQYFAAIAHDDVDNLQSTGTMLDSVMGVKNEFLLGRERGYATSALGKTGGKMLQDSWFGKPLLEADRAKARRQTAEMEKMRGSGGFAESFGALEGQMESGVPQQAEMAGVGAVAGGAILGLPTGGLGLFPGMVAGAELGFVSASAVQSFEIESGSSFVDLLDQDIPEDTARIAATIVGTINAALEMIPLKFFTSRAKSLIKSTVQEQVVSSLVQVPGIKNAVGKFVKEWTMGIGVESVTEVVQELTSMWGEEFSKYQTDPDFQAKMTTPAGRMEVANRLLSTFEEVAKGMAVMGFIMPGANFALDAKRARKANKVKQFFKDIGKDAAASKVRERNPNSYQAWFAARAKGTGAETIYVDVDKVRGAMVKNGINQEQLQFLLPDLYKQLQAIGANSGVDVTIPTSVYAARLVDTAFGQDLQSDMRLNPDDMSINDNNEYVKTRDRRVAELVKLSDEMTASDEILAESAKVVENRVVSEIMAVGKYTELEAKAMAAAHVAFAVVTSASVNMTPDQFDIQYGMTTRGEGQVAPTAPAAPQQVAPALSVVANDKVKAKAVEFGISKSQISEAETIASSIADNDWVGLAFSDEEAKADSLARAQQDLAIKEKYKDKNKLITIDTSGVIPSREKVDARITTKSLERALAEIEKVFEEYRNSIGVRFVSIGLGDKRATVNLQVQLLSETQIREELANRAKAAKQAQAAPLQQTNQFDQASRIDADYMAAVERGDMETTQRMVDEAAKAAGYTSPIVHHGSIAKGVTQFNVGKSVEVEGGIFFTTNEDVAAQYTFERAYGDIISDEPLGDVTSAKLRMTNPYEYQAKGKVVDAIEMQRAVNFAKSNGYDGVIIRDIDDSIGMTGDMGDVYVVFNGNQIKSADPITRDAIGNVIPLSRRFNIASTSILEQAAKVDVITDKQSKTHEFVEGKPVTISAFHGTRTGGFTKFDPTKIDTGAAERSRFGMAPLSTDPLKGFWFTNDSEQASNRYAMLRPTKFTKEQVKDDQLVALAAALNKRIQSIESKLTKEEQKVSFDYHGSELNEVEFTADGLSDVADDKNVYYAAQEMVREYRQLFPRLANEFKLKELWSEVTGAQVERTNEVLGAQVRMENPTVEVVTDPKKFYENKKAAMDRMVANGSDGIVFVMPDGEKLYFTNNPSKIDVFGSAKSTDELGALVSLSRQQVAPQVLEQAVVPAPSTGVFDARNPPVSSEPIFAVMNADGQIYYDVNATMHGDLVETFPDIADTTIDGGFIINGKYKMGMSDGGYSAFEGTSEQVEQVKKFTKQANTVPQVLEQAAMAEPGADSPGVGVGDEPKLGFWKPFRVKVVGDAEIPAKKLILTGTKNNNADKQLVNVDGILAKFPAAGESIEEWTKMMAYALGSDEVPIPPYAFIKGINGDGSFNTLSKLTEGQISDANHGFENAAELRAAYISGELSVTTTAKLILWSFLSRGVSPYRQESLFIDAFDKSAEWIGMAAEGKFSEEDFPAYDKWARSAAPKGSGLPGAGATHNLNAFGKDFLFKMSKIGDNGKSHLQNLHDMLSDPNQTGQSIRREFAKIGEGVGIDNKVMSFTLLVAGFDDVMVLDRVQIRQLWDDGRFPGVNLYDGTMNEQGKKISGSSMNDITEGVRGILVYEALERQLQSKIYDLYARLGRPQDASVGRYHWETWVAFSQQEASHGTLAAVLADAKGDDQAIANVASKEGEYGAYEYGAMYNRNAAGVPWFQYQTPSGNSYSFTVSAFREFLANIKQPKNGVVPTQFKVTESANAPWYTRPEVNQQRLDEQAAKWADLAGGTGEGKRIVDEIVREQNANRARSAADAVAIASQWEVPALPDGSSTLERKFYAGGSATKFARVNRQRGIFDTHFSYERQTVADTEGLYRLGVPIVGEYVAGVGLAELYKRSGNATPTFYELGNTAAASERFHAAIVENKQASPFGAAVAVYTPKEYRGMRLFLSADGKSGVAVKPDGDIVSVFAANNSGRALIELAVSAGGTKLDAFDTVLAHFYAPHGFVVASRMAWNEEFKPEGWDKQTFSAFNNGEPNVVFMARDDAYMGSYKSTDGKSVTEYDNAVKAQSETINVINKQLFQAMPSPGRRGSFDPTRWLTTLNTKADLSTFLHESSHFFFSVYTDIASRPGAPARIAADVQILLDSFGVKDIAAWNAMTFEEQRKYQEQFAYNFEIYLFEGKAPSIEMQGLFERFSKWLRRVYTSISTELNDIYRREFGEDLPILTDEIRGVMGRMLASEAQIKRAEAVNEMKPQFQTQAESGMDDARWAAYQAMIQEAHDQAVTDLTKASLRQMEWLSNARSRLLKNMQSKHDEIRKEMRAEIEAEVMAEPLYMAMSILKTGQGRAKNGELVQFNDKFKLNLEAVKKMLPSEEIAKLGYGKYGMVSEDGIPPDMVAEIVGFVSGDELVLALLTAKPAKEEIAERLDKRMMDEYGKMNTPEAREAAVQAAIHNEARERFVAVEARFIAKATQPVRVMIDAAKAAARQIVGAKKIDDISPGEYAAAEARASRDAAEAYKDRQTPDAASKSTYTRVYNEQIAKGVDEATAVAEATSKAADASTKAQGKAEAYKAKYGDRTPEQVIIRAKQAQVLQNQLVKEATSSLEEVDTAVKDFRKFFGSDEKIAKSRNMDLVDAARAILSYYGFGKVDKNPADYIKKLEAYNPELYAEIKPLISQASTGVRDYTQMTMDDFRMLRDVVDALWAQSRRDKQITVAGKKIALDGVLSELDARLNEIGVPTTVPGEKSALTTKEKFAAHLYSAKALLRRVENWADATDGAGGVGAFTKYIYRPVKDAVNAYRVDRNNYVKRFVDLVSTLDLPVGKITSPELDYTFGVGNGGIGKAELLGAMLHTGNESNYKKLLIGRKWGEFNDDESVNTSRWDAFVGRMITEGVLTKEDFDFLQAVWDLNEEIKPIAQRAHRDLYGYYFKEVEATSFTNRFGTYRGGYVPAKTDATIVRDAQRQAKAEELDADFRSSMPSTGMGFTKGRVEYNKPLSLDVRLMAKHIDDVLRFANIQPAIKDALRIVNNRAFADKLSSIDPTAVEFMLLPWLNRTARQSTNEPGMNKDIDNFWRTLRSRTGMSIMFANIRNALQQVTGLFPSALKVSKGALKDSLFAYLASPRKTAEAIAGLSPFMNERMHSQIFEIQDQMNDLLLNPSKFDKIQKWSQHHGYFLQSAFQNFVDIVTWNGKYNQVLSEIGTTLSDSEAQVEAIQQADAAVRSTQGSMSAEDVAAFEVGSPFYKTFVQFTGYFNMLANLNTDEYVKVLRDLGWRGNKGKLVSIYMLGFLAPTLVADAIARSLGAGWDDDDDGYLDDVADWFFGSQVRAGAAMVPFGSAAYTALSAGFTKQTYDDRITSSPSIGSLEASTVGVGKAVVNLASKDKELTGRNVRDVLTLITNATGVSVSVLGRPIGYQVDVARGKVEPTDPIDYMRGLITGVPSAESKKK